MTTSNSRNFILTRNQIISAALRKIGAISQSETPGAAQIVEASEALNIMVNSWQNDDIFLWTTADDLQVLTASQRNYTQDSDMLELYNLFFRRDGSDTPITVITQEEYTRIANKATVGIPNQAYLDYQLAAPVLYLYPVPQHTTTIVTGTDANKYMCKKSHTSSNDTKPITGADYTDYWELTSEATNAVWELSTAYYSDRVHFRKILQLQDFDSPANNPDFPARWYKALIYGLAIELAPEYGVNADLRTLVPLYENEFYKAKNGSNESGDLILSVRMN